MLLTTILSQPQVEPQVEPKQINHRTSIKCGIKISILKNTFCLCFVLSHFLSCGF